MFNLSCPNDKNGMNFDLKSFNVIIGEGDLYNFLYYISTFSKQINKRSVYFSIGRQILPIYDEKFVDQKFKDLADYMEKYIVNDLAYLISYLRYNIRENDFLIIEYPEIGLHPTSQVKLLEVFLILANLGIIVVIGTHSPYFLAHLNNIVIGSINPEILKQQSKLLYTQNSKAFIPIDKVSAYELKVKELKSLKDEDFGIRYDTLSEVSSDIQQKYFKLQEYNTK